MENFAYGECSKPKKSKSCQETEIYMSNWAHLPALVLHKIFNMLDKQDRKNTSSVCRYWRQNSFHPKWWPAMTFKIEEHDMNKARFHTSTFGRIVSEATIILNSLSVECVEEFMVLLKLFNENNHLRSIILEPTHCQLEMPYRRINCSENSNNLSDVMNLLMPLLPRLEKFSIGCIEDLCTDVESILSKLNKSKVTLLGLASVKDDPCKYESSYFDPELIAKFVNLEVLSVDYEQVSDGLLEALDGAGRLQRLVVHVHGGVPADHPGTTEEAWRRFRRLHPTCQLRLTLIHAFDGVGHFHEAVLRKQMPLTHMKVFFCENVNKEALHNLSTYYADTFRSLMWVDSLGGGGPSWALARPSAADPSPDPLVLLAWLCRYLEEIVLLGYKYPEENLVALGRLRGRGLRRLDVAEDDVLFGCEPRRDAEDALLDVPKSLQKPWAPLKRWELHPVVRDPIAGDSDEFILPIVLADLH